MFFEGSEKKLEVIVNSKNLKTLGDDFWKSVVETCGAKILNKLSTDQCDSYLLSESSLFVWDDRFTMLTCGTTRLIDSVFYFLEKNPQTQIECLIYERKNEYYPHMQHSGFFDDFRRLKEKFTAGNALRFGRQDEHHLLLFNYESETFKPVEDDSTLEVLMYGIQGEAKETFTNPKQCLENIRKTLALDKLLPEFTVQDFLFEPCGYSLNALRGDDYYTIHVTPEEEGSYVSFETNFMLGRKYSTVIQEIVNVFKPRSFDVVLFRHSANIKFNVQGYELRSAVQQKLNSGYDVKYCHFSEPVIKTEKAFCLKELC